MTCRSINRASNCGFLSNFHAKEDDRTTSSGLVLAWSSWQSSPSCWLNSLSMSKYKSRKSSVWETLAASFVSLCLKFFSFSSCSQKIRDNLRTAILRIRNSPETGNSGTHYSKRQSRRHHFAVALNIRTPPSHLHLFQSRKKTRNSSSFLNKTKVKEFRVCLR